jgi:peptidoglycan/LPS O-acetylase OafA/YrhL
LPAASERINKTRREIGGTAHAGPVGHGPQQPAVRQRGALPSADRLCLARFVQAVWAVGYGGTALSVLEPLLFIYIYSKMFDRKNSSYDDNLPTRLPLLSSKLYEYELEGLRGFAAIVVAWYHFLPVTYLPTSYYTSASILAYVPPAHLSVLIFFVLSGYVIGLTNQRPLTAKTSPTYLEKRLLRIYPIYLVSILVALVIAVAEYSLPVILGNVLFLQILLVPIIGENATSWSLHYEVLYYLLFIPISLLRLNALAVVIGSLVCGLLCFHLLPMHPLPASYALGFTFWACGLALARYAAKLPRLPVSYSLLLSTLLLLFSFRNFNYLATIERNILLKLLGYDWVYRKGPDVFATIMEPYDLAYLPYAVFAILIFTHKDFPFRKSLLTILFLLPGLTFFGIFHHWSTLDKAQYVVSGTTYCTAVVLFFSKASVMERVGEKVMQFLIRAGSISYGIYIIHYPLLHAFQRVSLFPSSQLMYSVQVIVLALLTGASAYLLEKKFQPAVRQWLTRTPALLEKD